MQCEYDINDAFDYLDETLSQTSASAFQLHATECSACQSALSEAKTARGVWLSAKPLMADEHDWAKMDRLIPRSVAREALDNERRALRGGHRWNDVNWLRGAVWVAAAAAIVVAAYMSVSALNQSTDSTAADEVADPGDSNSETTSTPTPRVKEAPKPTVAVKAATPLDYADSVGSGHEIRVGEVISAGTVSRTVEVSNARLVMAPSAVLRVARRDGQATVVELVAGRVTFDVAKRTAGTVFQVRAGQVLVTVLGTQFTVHRAARGTVGVSVREGRVSVRHADAQPVYLRAGQGTIIEPVDTQPVVTQVSPGEQPAKPSVQSDAVVSATDQPADDTAAAPKRIVRAAAKQRRVVRTSKRAAVQGRSRRTKTRTPSARVRSKQVKTVTKASPAPPVKSPEPAKKAKVILIDVRDAPVKHLDEKGKQTDTALIGRSALTAVLRSIGSDSYSTSIRKLSAWLKQHPGNRLSLVARYAIGYCEFKRGNKKRAFRIFARMPRRNRWIRKSSDFDNPPRPRL